MQRCWLVAGDVVTRNNGVTNAQRTTQRSHMISSESGVTSESARVKLEAVTRPAAGAGRSDHLEHHRIVVRTVQYRPD